MDYAGLTNRWIQENSAGTLTHNTSIKGTVKGLELPDGQAEVTVRIKTKRALTYVVPECDFSAAPVSGNRAPEVFGGADPALSEFFMKVVFKNAAGGNVTRPHAARSGI